MSEAVVLFMQESPWLTFFLAGWALACAAGGLAGLGQIGTRHVTNNYTTSWKTTKPESDEKEE